MSFRRRQSLARLRKQHKKRRKGRELRVEQLEDRRLLATGPDLFAIQPDNRALLQEGDTLNIAPQELTFLFKGGSDIDPSTIPGNVRLTRSGFDGSFNEGNEVPVEPGHLGLVDPGNPNQIVLRPAATLPDEHYRIEIIGEGDSPLASSDGSAFDDGRDFTLDFQLDLGAQVISVVPQPIQRDPATGLLSQDRDQIVVYLNEDDLDESQATDPKYYRLFDTAATLDEADDAILIPSDAAYDATENTVTLEFDADLPDGTYRLDIGVSDEPNNRVSDAINVGTLFDTTEFEYLGYLGDDVQTNDNESDVDLYRIRAAAGGDLEISVSPRGALNADVRLLTGDGETEIAPSASSEGGVGGADTLNFDSIAGGEMLVEVSSEGGAGGTGSYLLEIDVAGSGISASDANSAFDTATELGVVGIAGARHSAQIEPQTHMLMPPFPGGTDEPGHREIQAECHFLAGCPFGGVNRSVPNQITQRRYNFQSVIGTDPQGNELVNLISRQEKQLAREIFEIYGAQAGIEFIETPSSGTTIAKGDLRAADPDVTSGPGGIAGLGGPGLVVVDSQDFPRSNNQFGGGFFTVLLHEIGHSLGLGHSYDIRSNMGAGLPGPGGQRVYPGDHDLVHLQRVWRPDSTDIDLYEFALDQPGFFSAETIAERTAGTNLLNSALTLFDADGEVVSRNDDYFSNDSFIGIELEAGTYYLGVSSTGNVDYDPNIVDSGFGGTTDGPYDLQLDFTPAPKATLVDTTGTLFDGDADGRAGGRFSFWFQSSANTIFVDKANDTTANVVDGSGTLDDPYDTIGFALDRAANRIVVPSRDGVSTVRDGATFVLDDGTNPPVTFEFRDTLVGDGLSDDDHIAVTYEGGDDAETVAAAIETAIDGAFNAATATADGDVVVLSGITDLDVIGSHGLLTAPNLVRIVGNGGLDGDIFTLEDNDPYLIGLDNQNRALPDGEKMKVPQGVTTMIDAGTLFKMRKANLDAGTSATGLSRRGGAIQVLGTPANPVTGAEANPVYLRSFRNDAVGGDSDGVGPGPRSGDFGGIVFRKDSDLEDEGVFLNWVNHADIRNGGGKVTVNSVERVFTPIHMVDARPTVSFNTITDSNDAAISANPNSFDDRLGRLGPEVHGNTVVDNTVNGLFVRIETEFGKPVEKLDVTARFDDTDIPHVITENLHINGNPGGPTNAGPRLAGRLHIDPGVVVKLGNSRIEMERGASNLIAEGNDQRSVIFTSTNDTRFGGSGTFNTSGAQSRPARPGDWGGLIFNHVSSGSIDHALIAFAGGTAPIEGDSVEFNAVEVHQAQVRVANSVLADNAAGRDGSTRNGRGRNEATTVFVRGAQPVIVDNIIRDNAGSAISINANSLQSAVRPDVGRSTGPIDAFEQVADNRGPLVRLNRLVNNATNGMEVRAEEITGEKVWDDTDMVHVVRDEIILNNHHTFSTLRLQSNKSENLVVKLQGQNAGFTANGKLLEIDDRLGGTLQVLGAVGHPVIFTSLRDDTVGAGFTPEGAVSFDTNNDGPSRGSAGDWRSILLDRYSNDRNVRVVNETEDIFTKTIDTNADPDSAQVLGTLAPDLKSGDENRRLGFEVQGFISPGDRSDVDVFSFSGTPGTEVWLDIDRSSPSLDAVVEVVNASGTVRASSVDNETLSPEGFAQPLDDNPLLGGDFYTLNPRDPGMRLILPGDPDETGTYFVRVRSNPQPDNPMSDLEGGLTSGEYRLQIRLDQVDEFPGSTVRFSDVRFAETGIDLRGLPAHSNVLSETAEFGGSTAANPQYLGSLLETDMAVLGVGGEIDPASGGGDVDFYRFEVQHAPGSISPFSDVGKTISAVFDIDYADGAARADTNMAVYDQSGRLVLMGRESNVEDDRGRPGFSPDIEDLSRGSLGPLDPFIGPVHLPEGGSQEFVVAVSSNSQLPSTLDGFFNANASDPFARLEPVNSTQRIVEDHIGFQGYHSHGRHIGPEQASGLVDISSETALDTHIVPYDLGDVSLFLATEDDLLTANPFAGGQFLTRVAEDLSPEDTEVGDIVMRSDGRFFGYAGLDDVPDSVGALMSVPLDGSAATPIGRDNIPGRDPTPPPPDPEDPQQRVPIEEITTSDKVDALTFERTGDNGEPDFVPEYDLYYAVRESDVSSKLYQADPGSGSAESIDDFGLVGDIQPSGVRNASYLITFRDDDDPPNSTTIRVESKLPGELGADFSVDIRRGDFANPVNVNADPNSNTLVIRVDNDPDATAQQFTDAINDDADARSMATAVITRGGFGTAGDRIVRSRGAFGTGTPLSGRVTGLAFGDFFGGQLYGVTSGGEFLRISKGTGRATVLNRLPTQNFQGLALGPQNVREFLPDGSEIPARYKNLLFAITSGGRLYAFNTSGQLEPVFDGDGDGFAESTFTTITGKQDFVGLAFSPLDFNLWHPTTLRGTDSGHGVNAAFEESRNPGDEAADISDPGPGPDRTATEADGGASLYFGFEPFVNQPLPTTNSYLTFSDNAQLGIENFHFQADLSTNPDIIPGSGLGSYNLAGGGHGSVITNSFSLEPYDAKDKPTLYLNYFLDTENHPGANTDNNPLDPFRDSARVFISNDGGNNWELLATNNSAPTTTSGGGGRVDAELSFFQSDSATEGLRATSPRIPIGDQQVQELFDSTGTWRQARVDLTGYAEEPDLRFRVDFSTAGTMNDPSVDPVDRDFGEFTSSTRSIRSLDNQHEGFFIDDIVVGLSERGEIVTGSGTNQNFFGVPQPPASLEPRPESLVGPYQLEIRRAEEFGFLFDPDRPDIRIQRIFDTNERQVSGHTIPAPTGDSLSDGMTFSIVGRRTEIFEFDSDGRVERGQHAIPFNPGMSQRDVAESIRTAINAVSDFGVSSILHTDTTHRVDLVGAKDLQLVNSPVNVTAEIADATISEGDSNPATVVDVTLEEPAPTGGTNVTLDITDSGAPANPNATFAGGTTSTVVTIPAGEVSPPDPIPLFVVDDSVADGSQTVVVVPTAVGYTGVSDTVDVLDDDLATLTVDVTPSSIGEDSATPATATITRNNALLDRPMEVQIASLDPSEIRVGDGSVREVEPNNTVANVQDLDQEAWTLGFRPDINTSTSFPHVSIEGTGDGTFDYYGFTVSNDGDQGVFDIDANFGAELFLFDAGGAFIAGDNVSSLEHTFDSAGTYIIAVGGEDSAAVDGSVIGNAPQPADSYTLHVSVEHHPRNDEIFTAVIPAGSTSVDMDLHPVEDWIMDGTQTATLVAASADLAPQTANIDVIDSGRTRELTLTVNSPNAISESAGDAATTATVTRNNAGPSVVLDLLSHDTSEATVPPTIEIPAGQSQATFDIAAVDDLVQDGDHDVLITAYGNGFPSAGDTVTVSDDPTDPAPRSGPREIGANFTGGIQDDPDTIPPDTMGGVGPDHVVELINGRFAVYDKDGNLLAEETLDEFWQDADADPEGTPFDPRILYDHASGHWFAASVDNEGEANNVLVAVSDNSDPTGDWTGFAIDSDSDDERSATFPTMGVDADGLYISLNMVDISADDPLQIDILSIPKDDLTISPRTVANATLFEDLAGRGVGSSIQPAVDFGPSDGRAALLAADTDVLRRTDLLDGDTSNPALTDPTDIATPASNVPAGAAPQPGRFDDLDTGGIRFASNVFEADDNTLWAVHTVEDPGTGNAAVRWYQIDEATNEILQSGTITDQDLHFYYPSIVVNRFGDAVIGFSGSSTEEFVGSYAAVGDTFKGVTKFDPPTLLQPGAAKYERLDSMDRNRWGDHSATVYDPTDPTRFWTFQEFVESEDTWAIQITEILVPSDERDVIVEVTGSKALSEDGNSAPDTTNGELRRTGDTTEALDVTITFDAREVTINGDASGALDITIPAGDDTVPLTIGAINDPETDGVQTVVLQPTAEFYHSVSDVIDVFDADLDIHATMTAEVAADQISENGGSTPLTLTRSDTIGNATVSLLSSDPGEAVGASPVTIGAGDTTQTGTVAGIDETVLDGTQTAIIIPSTAGQTREYQAIRDFVEVLDDETRTLTVNVSTSSISEGDGQSAASGSVILDGTVEEDLLVTVHSSDPSEAILRNPLTGESGATIDLIIPAGSAAASFEIDAVNEFTADGMRSVTFTAFAPSFLSGSDQLNVFSDGPASSFEAYNRTGDANRFRPQGQVIIESNFVREVSDFGINVEAGQRDANGGVPHPGSTINFPLLNADGIAPGAVIQNNVVALAGQGGIRFAGDPSADPQVVKPQGRIANNTVYGGTVPNGTGILVEDNASPTLLNNLLAHTSTAISLGAGTADTVINSNHFVNNTARGNAGTNPTSDPLASDTFVNPDRFNFYPKSGSIAIDSSLNTMQDRGNFVAFKAELGIPESPVFAPERDVYGQLRVDDPDEDPLGGGSAIFKDRGAVDRADDARPFAVLLNPVDNDVDGNDIDPNDTVVHLKEALLSEFSIFLGDGPGLNSPFQGTGVDPLTVDDPEDPAVAQQSVQVSRNGVQLTRDVDYTLGYNANDNRLLLTPLSALWEPDSVYVVELDNTQIKDLGGNRLSNNQPSGETRFTILLGEFGFDYGDAPDSSYGTVLTSDGARHVQLPESPLFLGERVDTEQDGQPSVRADGDDSDQFFDFGTSVLTQVPAAPYTIELPSAGGAAVPDGQFFTIDDDGPGPNPPIRFEFDRDGDDALALPIVPIVYFAPDSMDLMVDRVANAINGSDLTDVTARNLSGGRLRIGGGEDFQVKIAPGAASLALANQLPITVEVPSSGIADGQTFAVHDGSHPAVTFEFEDPSVTAGLSDPDHVPVNFDSGAIDPDEIAANIATAVQSQMDAGALRDLTVSASGDRVEIIGPGDDEDGVEFGNLYVPGDSADGIWELDVVASGSGMLDAWIDFNQNGQFDPVKEKLPLNGTDTGSVSVVEGPNGFAFDIELVAAGVPVREGPTYARFRISESGDLFPTLLSVGGEVEDYEVRILTNTAPEVVNSFATLIDDGDVLQGMPTIDIDGDRVPDVTDTDDDGILDVDENALDTLQIDLEDVNGKRVFDDIDISNGNGDSLTYSVVSNDNSALVTTELEGSLLELDFQPDANGMAEIVVQAMDQGGLIAEDTLVIDVRPMNSDPRNDGSLPTDVMAVEDLASDIDLSLIELADPDAEGGDMTVTLSTSTGGTLSAEGDDDVTVSGAGTSSLVVEGSLDALNAFLDDATNIQFTGAPDLNGEDADTITIEVSDNGNTGIGGGDNVNLGTVNVDISAVNDDPENTGSLPTDVTVLEDVSSPVDLSQIELSDVDAAAGDLDVTLSTSAGGTLSAGSGGGVTVTDSGTDTLLLTGQLADLNAFLDDGSNIEYLSVLNVNGDNADTINIQVNDNGNTGDGGGDDVDLGTVNVDIAAVNDDPFNDGSLPDDISAVEDQASDVDLSAIEVADVDAGTGNLTITLSTSTGGTLRAASGGGVTVGGVDTTSLSLEGQLDDLNAFLDDAANIQFVGAPDLNGEDADTITIEVSDNGNTGVGGGNNINFGEVRVDIDPVNDDPENGGSLPTDVTAVEDELSPIDLGAIEVVDVDAADGDLIMTLTTSAGGTLSATSDGGVTVTGSTTTRLRLVGTLDDLNAFLDDATNIQYLGVLNADGDDADAINILVSDNGNTGAGGGDNVSFGTVNVDIDPVNDDPFNDGSLPDEMDAFEDVKTDVDLGLIELVDVDSGDGDLTLTLSTSDGGTLSATSGGGVTVTGGETPAMTLSGTLDDLNAFLNVEDNIQYLSVLNAEPGSTDTIDVQVTDNGNTGSGGGGNIALGTVDVTILPVNDDPVNVGSLPTDVEVTEDVPGNVDLSLIEIDDVDAGTGELTVTLSTSAGGELSASSGGGVTVEGSGSTSLTLTGQLDALNDYWDDPDRLEYLGPENLSGDDADTILVQVTDNGNTGAGGGGNVTFGTVNVDIARVNDDPEISPESLSMATDEDLALVFNAANDSLIRITDVDANEPGGGDLKVTLEVDHGTLRLNTTDNLNNLSGNESATVTFEGAEENINAALDGLLYSPDPNSNTAAHGPETLVVTVNDQGNTGSGGGVDVVRNIPIDVRALNDAPVITPAAPSVTTDEDTSFTFDAASSSLITVDDVDLDELGAGELKMTLQVSHGTLQLGSTANLNNLSGNGSDTVMFEAGLTDVNAALDGLIYTPDPNYNSPARGPENLVVTADDQGNTGEEPDPPGSLQDTKQIPITVNAINDAPQLTAPGPQSLDEGTDGGPLNSVTITGISVEDVDAQEGGAIRLTLSVPDGAGRVAVDPNVSGGVGTVSGNNTETVTLTGSVEQINLTLASGTGVTYTVPNDDFNNKVHGGDVLLTVNVNDQGNTGQQPDPPGFLEDTDEIPITVNPVNDPPEAFAVQLTAQEDGDVVSSVPFNADDVDLDDDPTTLIYALLSSPAEGTVTENGDGTFNFDPGDDFQDLGADEQREITFDYKVTDSHGAESGVATVTVTVEGVNDAPVAQDDSFSTTPGTLEVAAPGVLAEDEDVDGDPLEAILVEDPSTGTLTLDADGSFTYTSQDGFTGFDSFTYKANDGLSDSNVATITVRVVDPPVADDIEVETLRDRPVIIDILSNVEPGDEELDPTSIAIVDGPSSGSVEVDDEGSVTFSPAVGFTGQDSFRYTIDDSIGVTSNAAQVSIDVKRPHPWQNQDNRMDVDGDGQVSPIDVLLIVNELNARGARQLPNPPEPEFSPPPFHDVNGDESITSIDVLIVVNFLNSSVSGEGEAVSRPGDGQAESVSLVGAEGEFSPPAANAAGAKFAFGVGLPSMTEERGGSPLGGSSSAGTEDGDERRELRPGRIDARHKAFAELDAGIAASATEASHLELETDLTRAADELSDALDLGEKFLSDRFFGQD